MSDKVIEKSAAPAYVDCPGREAWHVPGKGPCSVCGYDIELATHWENGGLRLLTTRDYVPPRGELIRIAALTDRALRSNTEGNTNVGR